jgi:hypothetical protein
LAQFDYSGPFVAARIRDVDGNTFPLWTNVGGSETDPVEVPGGEDLQALAFLQEVTVQMGLSFVPQISAQLAPPFREGILFLNSRLADAAGSNVLEVQLGYTGGTGSAGPVLTPPMEAVIMNPDISIDVEIQITLNGQGTGGFSAWRRTGTRVTREGTTRRSLIQEIADGLGVEVNFEDPDSDPNSDARELLDEEGLSWSQGGKTDWMAMWELTDSARCHMSLVGRTLFILSKRARILGQPLRTYRFYDYPGGSIGGRTRGVGASDGQTSADLPILSFTSSTNAVWLPPASLNVVLRDVNESSREAETTVLNDASEAPARSGEGAASPPTGTDTGLPEPDEATGDGGQTLPGAPDVPEAVREAQEEFSRGGHLGIQVEIETIGDPQVLPGDAVRLAGLGRRFDDRTYVVHKITHQIGLGGFTTNLELVTNVDSLIEQFQGAQRTSGPTNTQETREAGPDQTVQPRAQQEE